jgi:hypothetical protein
MGEFSKQAAIVKDSWKRPKSQVPLTAHRRPLTALHKAVGGER